MKDLKAFENVTKYFNVGSDQLGGYKEPVLFSMDWIEEEVAEETSNVSSSIANLSDFPSHSSFLSITLNNLSIYRIMA